MCPNSRYDIPTQETTSIIVLTSEADDGADVAEHVAERDGGQVLHVVHGQAGCLTELEEPQGENEDGAHDELSHADAPRQRDGVESFLPEVIDGERGGGGGGGWGGGDVRCVAEPHEGV